MHAHIKFYPHTSLMDMTFSYNSSSALQCFLLPPREGVVETPKFLLSLFFLGLIEGPRAPLVTIVLVMDFDILLFLTCNLLLPPSEVVSLSGSIDTAQG